MKQTTKWEAVLQLSTTNRQDGSLLTTSTLTLLGLRIINSLNVCSGDYKICSINAYFPPTNGRTDPATHHTRIASYQHCPEMPYYVKHQATNEYARSFTRKRIAKKIFDGFFVVLTGGLNDSHGTYSFKVFMTAHQLMNPLHAAFGHEPLFHTRDANSLKMNNTDIDHALHSPLSDNIVLR
jgi:hypothetical protein